MGIYSLFARIFDYPVRPIAEQINDCAAELALESAEASVSMAEFQSAVAVKSVGQIQELYTNAFDLRPECTPNLSYHLFGDDGRRGLFLAEMKGRLEACGIDLGSELPDHLTLLLRYLDLAETEGPALIEDCMLPALCRMVEVLGTTGNPYQHALIALRGVLQQQHDTFKLEVAEA